MDFLKWKNFMLFAKKDPKMDEIQVIEEDINEINDNKDNQDNEQVITYVETDIILFKIESIVLKSLITKEVKKSLHDTNKNLKTNLKLEIIKSNYALHLVRIWGEDKNKVIETKMVFNQLISLSRKKIPFTHLITVPFNCEPLRQEFSRFKDNVLTNFKHSKGIDENLFQKPFKLHLTFCVLVLLNQNEVLSAQRILKQCVDQIVRPIIEDKPLNVLIEGLDVIKGQPNRAHVLYAQISDESNKLQSIADQTVTQFVKSGLCVESNENKVKLHITFMNSLFRQRILSKTYPKMFPKRIKRETFDAKQIIDSYKHYKFSEIVVQSIQLNDINCRTEDGYYGLVDAIHLHKQ